MYDDHLNDQNLLNYEFEQMQLDRLRRIYRTEQRELAFALFFQKNKNHLFVLTCLIVFGLGYVFGVFVK